MRFYVPYNLASIIVAVFVFCMPLFSQLSEMRVVGTPQPEPSELIAREVMDANMETCAGVIVYSDLVGLKYQSANGIVKINHIEGKDFLFVSPDERMVEVFCLGFTPLKIFLNDLGVHLKSGTSWSLKITGDKKLDVIPVNMILQPPDIEIFVDGENKGREKTQQITVGRHELQFVKKGFKTEVRSEDVSTTNNLFTVQLQEIEPVRVKIRSIPTGAQVFIDNVGKGETNKDPFLYPGEYTLKLVKSGFVTIEKKITVNEIDDNLFSTVLEKNSGILTVTVTPADARVTINTVEYTGKQTLEMPPGSYMINVEKNGYADRSDTVELTRGGSVKKTFVLEKNSSTLTLTVTPSDARVTIDKEDFTAKASVELAPGRHKVDVQKDGYIGQSETIDLARGGRIMKQYLLVAKTGALQLSVQPVTARVQLLRGSVSAYSWEGSKMQKAMPVGKYDLVCTVSGYKTLKKNITIAENRTTVEDVVMQTAPNEKAVASKARISSPLVGDFFLVKGGTFNMGSDEYMGEKPVHSVTVSDFYIGKCEVTQKQWTDLMATNPSRFKGDNLPVENVSLNDILEFIQKLNQKEGSTVYRLPTEAEWEYAARGGISSRGFTYSGSNTAGDVAWFQDNSGSKTHAVGTKKPNELGVFDMSGNVWEWCSDWYDPHFYSSSPNDDPQCSESSEYRVLRGGSWDNTSKCARSANRYMYRPDSRYDGNGFRCARNLQ